MTTNLIMIVNCFVLLAFLGLVGEVSSSIPDAKKVDSLSTQKFAKDPKYLQAKIPERDSETYFHKEKAYKFPANSLGDLTGFPKLDNVITSSHDISERGSSFFKKRPVNDVHKQLQTLGKFGSSEEDWHRLNKLQNQTRSTEYSRRRIRSNQNFHHRVARNRPQFVFPPIEQIVAPGSPVSLKCAAIGAPPLSISWSRDSMVLVPSLRTHISNTRRETGEVLSLVNITNTNQRDGGLFTCLAENAFGREERSARLNVYGPPFIRPMLNISAVAGKSASVRCPYGGYPKPEINWEFNRQPIQTSSRHKIYDNATLEIPSVKRHDGGRYACIAVGREGRRAMSETYMKILFPPDIEKLYFADDLEEGKRTSLICMVTSGDLPISIRWMKDNQPLLHDPDIKQKQISDYSMVLLFEKLSARHSGNYTCVATNNAASGNRSASLLVNVAPKWVIQPSDISVSVGSPVKIDCEATGVPPPTTRWIHAITETGKGGTSDTLIFSQIRKSDSGSYRCESSNGVGPPISQIINIDVNAKAQILSSGGIITGHLKRSARLKCEAKGDPPIYITWKKRGQSVIPNNRISIKELASADDSSRSVLEIKWLQTSDQGEYTCEARNNFGRAVEVYSLQILEPPASPTNLIANQIGSRSAQLSWKNSKPTSIILQFKESSRDWRTQGRNISIPLEQSTYTLKNLNPFTKYDLRMFAINELGSSAASNIISFKTKEDAPSTPPKDVRVSSSEPSTLHITWSHSQTSHSNENIQGFLIAYKEQNIGEGFQYIARPVTSDRNRRESYTVRGLKPNTLYEVALKSFNSVGNSPLSSPRIVQATRENVPECSPVGVHCREDNLAGIRVWWEGPHSSCRKSSILGYSILATPLTPRNLKKGHDVLEVTTTNLEKNLGNLPPATNVSIIVRATNLYGHGPPSQPIFCRTRDSVPTEVENVRVVVVDRNSVAVTWQEPSEFRGEIVRYAVYFEENGLVRTAYVTGDPTPKTSKVLNNFLGRSRVQIWVTASTLAGEGRASPKSSLIINPVSHAPIAVGTRTVAYVPEGFGLTIGCMGIGNPEPRIEWLSRQRKVKNDADHQLLPRNDLHIRVRYSANYTCRVSNINGEDTSNTEVISLTKPQAPQIALLGSTVHSLNISIATISDGGLPILGHIIFYRQKSGEWEELSVAPSTMTPLVISIRHLQCGSNVRLYATSLNSQGVSPQSSVIMASTKGSSPPKPDTTRLLVFNETCLNIHLYQWEENLCSITHWKVEVKDEDDSDWTILNPSVRRDTKTQSICGLQLTHTRYLKLTAFTAAGPSTVAYRISVEGIEEGWISSQNVQEVTLESRYLISSALDPHIIAGVISGILLCLAVGICAVVIVKKRWHARSAATDDDLSHKLGQMEDPAYIKYHIYSPTAGPKKNTNTRHKSRTTMSSFEPPDTEIYPYATFSSKSNAETLPCGVSLQMGSPVSRICYNRNETDGLRHYRKERPMSQYEPSELVYISSKSLVDDQQDQENLIDTRIRNKKNMTADDSPGETLPHRIDFKSESSKQQINKSRKSGSSNRSSQREYRMDNAAYSENLPDYGDSMLNARPHRDTPIINMRR